MGWLRDFMTTAEPPIPSFGKLAQACLDHPQWPAHHALKYRSLSTLFSKLDRNLDLDWLRDRLDVQQVLVDLLGRPLGDLRLSIGETPHSSQNRFLRFIDLRYARELDLTREDLPPGIPRQASDPPSWRPTWWLAPPGSGRTLTGAWLEARGLAHTHLIQSREDFVQLPQRGPLFLEIASTVTLDDLGPDVWQELRVERRPVCVTAAFAPPPLDGVTFELIESPAPERYVPELVDWVEERLDETGHFHAERVESWLLSVALPAGAISCWGDTLGLLGMADEVPVRSLLAKSLDELGAHFVERRLREANDDAELTPRQIADAFPRLKQCAARVLVTGRNALEAPHPVDEWTALLSTPQTEDSPDPEWFVAALRGALGAQVSKRDLRRAARKLPPSAYQLTRGLEAARLLVREGDALARDENGAVRTLHPRWLVSLLTARAAQEVLTLAPSQWGRVLLMGKDAGRIITGLIEAARRDHFSSCFDLVDAYEPGVPALSAALEGSIVAMGLATLEGLELPDELVEGLLALLAEEVFVVDKVPEPRLTISSEQGDPFTRETFLVAWAALCQSTAFPLEHLDPVRSKAPEVRRHFLTACATWGAKPWPSVSMRSGLLAVVEAICASTSGDELSRPAAVRLLDTISSAPPALFQEALASFPAEVLLAQLSERGTPPSRARTDLWRYAAHLRAPGRLFVTEAAEKEFWRDIPLDLLVHRVRADLPVSWESLLPHQYAAWFKLDDAPPLPEEAARTVPIDPAVAALDERGLGAFQPSALAVLSARAPGALARLGARYCRAGRGEDVAILLDRLGPSATEAFCKGLPSVDELLSGKPTVLRPVRLFLLRVIRARHPGFEGAFEVLTAIERGVGALRRLP